ncbi:hypothetical protein D3C81_582310 [compost metagenome]
MSQPVDKEPILVAKGEPNLLWRQWYAALHNMDIEHARNVQMAKIADMAEPSLRNSSGGPNLTWTLWYRVKNKVSKNVAVSICKKMIAGTYKGNAKLNLAIDVHYRKVIRDEHRERGEKPPVFFPHNPYIVIAGKTINLHKRLGNGEKTLEQLSRTVIGRQEIGRITLMGKEYADAIKNLVEGMNHEA